MFHELSSSHLLYELQYVNSNSNHLDHELNELTRDLNKNNNYKIK